ncbi:hypothetical protein [Sphingomonas sp.]|uniref:hypothetical protein n=1 Tax=Sphingomonas sp. TaxID=28214 RepID=UPI0025D639E4|nr:hypothetical protein [Sphingomonas sp.]MBV9528548.1 hypothetical protein [Sphingomonas sp.]
MILRLLNWQGIAGLVASIGLIGLVLAQHVAAIHWHRESDRFEKLYADEQLAFARTTTAYREAVEQARADDKANATRVAGEQQTINQRTSDDYEKRLADARSTADRLRAQLAAAPAHPGTGGAAPVPGLSAAAVGPPQAAGEDGLSDALIATEQAIQLDELIKWVRRQAGVNPNGGPGAADSVVAPGSAPHPR